MTAYIQAPENLKDIPLKIVSTKFQSAEYDNSYEKLVLESKISALQDTVQQLNDALNSLSSTTQSYVRQDAIVSNGSTAETTSSSTVRHLAVDGNVDAESEIAHWASGAVTKDYRYILEAGLDSDTFADNFAYDVPTDSELYTKFFIAKITRTAVGNDFIQTNIKFVNGKELTVNGIMAGQYGGPLVPFNEMSYLISHFSQIHSNAATTILSIGNYELGHIADWILLYLKNGKLVFWKRHFMY